MPGKTMTAAINDCIVICISVSNRGLKLYSVATTRCYYLIELQAENIIIKIKLLQTALLTLTFSFYLEAWWEYYCLVKKCWICGIFFHTQASLQQIGEKMLRLGRSL